MSKTSKNRELKRIFDVPRVMKYKCTEPWEYIDENFRKVYINSYITESDLYHDTPKSICFFNSKAYKKNVIDANARPGNNLRIKYPKFKI